MTIKVKLEGIKELRKAVQDFPNIARPLFRKAMDKTLSDIQAASVPLTPIDTGRLSGSYVKKRSDWRTKGASLKGEIDVNTKYAFYVHEGTYKMRKRPFLEKGIKTVEYAINNNFKVALEAVLKKVANSTKTVNITSGARI